MAKGLAPDIQVWIKYGIRLSLMLNQTGEQKGTLTRIAAKIQDWAALPGPALSQNFSDVTVPGDGHLPCNICMQIIANLF